MHASWEDGERAGLESAVALNSFLLTTTIPPFPSGALMHIVERVALGVIGESKHMQLARSGRPWVASVLNKRCVRVAVYIPAAAVLRVAACR